VVQQVLPGGRPLRREMPPVLPAQVVGGVQQDDAGAGRARGDGGAEPGRPAAHYENVRSFG
jgi:hypothetical protein